jgi:diguanylate cyclase (GGDEF)-like protein
VKTLSLRAIVSIIGLLVAVTTAVSVPAGYFAVGYGNLAGLLTYKAKLDADHLSKYIYTHDTLWQYQRVRLTDLLRQDDVDGDHKKVTDASGGLVLEDGQELASPVLSRSVEIGVSGASVGRIEVSSSLRPLVAETGVVAMLSLLLGCAMFLAVRVLPLRVLDRTLGALETTNQRLDMALSNMAQGLCLVDAQDRLVIWNRRFLETFGVPPEMIAEGMSMADFLAVANRAGNLYQEEPEAVLAARRLMRADGEPTMLLRDLADGRVLSVMHRPVRGGGWLSTFEDHTERRDAEAKILHMGLHDALTGLPNRLLFRQRMEHALSHLRRDEQVSVLCLDLDHFKNVNDTLGHPVGDALLRAVADRLKDCVREQDTIARLGGDEFAIVQVAVDPQHVHATSVANRIIEVLSAPYRVEGHQIVVGASVGIAVTPTDGTDQDQLLKNADLALYRAKTDGRGTYRYFEQQMDAAAQARRLLEIDLRAAVAEGQFELHYQPILDLGTDAVVSVEALVRWNHPKRGMIPPLEFIPLAEETGMIVALGEWVLRNACAEAVRWPQDIRVAVNLSPVQFKNRNLVASVANAVAAAGLAPQRLELEITEAVLLQESASTLATLHTLRAFGVRISMDDFGTGYSSLSYLRSFPFDKIKIDRSFITELATRDDAMAIVRAVTGLGKSLGISTTAEGVETNEQLALLRSEGCTEVQGYLLSRPLTAAGIESMLIANEGRAAA